jgi:serine protease Do
MKLKQVLATVAISAVTALAVIWGYGKFIKSSNTYAGQEKGIVPSNYKYAGFFDGTTPPGGAVDFTIPAATGTPAVVHIKTKTNAKQVNNNLPKNQRPQNPFSDFFDNDAWDQLFGGGNRIVPEQKASGSGVIISEDGYIVTNNHVVANADELTVTLSNKKTYKAKLIGTDASYDLAVIKIEATGLPFLLYGNSDDVKVGQWVMAIGYPLNLETTVTAGIVSAKSRSLGLNRDASGKAGTGVESFIQTDAAVNMGNSGGALLNTDAKLIGINSAIASPTGYYSGYSYAIPVNIVKKVVDDLIKFGNVQRGYLGVSTQNAGDIPSEEAKKIGLNYSGDGLVITEVISNSAAVEAGLKRGDIIKKVNGTEVTLPSELQENVTKLKPGDKVTIDYSRGGKEYSTTATLKNKVGNFDVVKDNGLIDKLGADLANLDPKKAKDYGVPGGVIIKKVKAGALNDQTRMKDGFVILKINDKDVKSVDELKAAIGNEKNITISGFYPGYDGVYEYPISLDDE